MTDDGSWIKEHVRDIPDFPKPGIVFKDLTPLLAEATAFRRCLDQLASRFGDRGVDSVVGIEARGFIFGAPVADRLRAGFLPVRKPGKLPFDVEREEYELEYGMDALEIHRDAIAPGDRVLVVDDVLATGGTAAAVFRLMERLEAEVVGLAVVLELGFLGGRSRLSDIDVASLLVYE